MLTMIIIAVLVYSFYTGFRRGLVMQVIQLVGYVITFFVASRLTGELAQYVEMLIPFPSVQQNSTLVFYNEAQSFLLNYAFYRAITFVLIGLVGFVLTKFVSVFFTRLTYYSMFKHIDKIGGAIVNLLITFICVFLFLFILSLIPLESIQQQFVDNPLAFRIVSDTPILSNWAMNAWLSVNLF